MYLINILLIDTRKVEVHKKDTITKNTDRGRDLSIKQLEEAKENENDRKEDTKDEYDDSNEYVDEEAYKESNRNYNQDKPHRKYTSRKHESNRGAYKKFLKVKSEKRKRRHKRNSEIKIVDLNYFKDDMKRNHNSHVHRVGEYGNRAHYTYFSYHPSIRNLAWAFHNAHHGVEHGWRDI